MNTVDRFQSDLDVVDIFTDEASMQLKISQDRDMLGTIYADAAAENKGATAGAISANLDLGTSVTAVAINNVSSTEFILRLGQVLDEQNVSDEGRWLVLPAWFIKKLKNSVLRAVNVSGDGVSMLRNGRVGMVDRFTIFQSNLMHTGVESGGVGATYTDIIAGHSAGLAWASQIVEMERLPNPWDFGQLIRGLCVYGYKVIEPMFVASAKVYETTDA